MLDKTLEYSGFARGRSLAASWGNKRLPVKNFQRIRIIFEDDIGWYVESLERKDASGNGIRYSVKKSFFVLKARNEPLKVFGECWRRYCAATIHPLDGEKLWKECCKWILEHIHKDSVATLERRIREEIGE